MNAIWMAARIAWDGDVHRTPLGKGAAIRCRTCAGRGQHRDPHRCSAAIRSLLSARPRAEGADTAANAVQALRGDAASLVCRATPARRRARRRPRALMPRAYNGVRQRIGLYFSVRRGRQVTNADIVFSSSPGSSGAAYPEGERVTRYADRRSARGGVALSAGNRRERQLAAPGRSPACCGRRRPRASPGSSAVEEDLDVRLLRGSRRTRKDAAGVELHVHLGALAGPRVLVADPPVAA